MSLQANIAALEERTLAALNGETNVRSLEELHSGVLGKKGDLTAILKDLRNLSPEERREAGQAANRLRERLERRFAERKEELHNEDLNRRLQKERYDALQPIRRIHGRLHPITRMQYQAEDIFYAMGFTVWDGPEIETDENNFGKLNFSDDHPARDDHDTYWTLDGHLLRTHTSPVQVRAMKVLKPPFRIIAPGRVYRYEELDASHDCNFHQIEGMMVDRDVSITHLIQVMRSFLSAVFEKDIQVRLRPGYFPFVEPGFELEISCLICDGSGCRTCKQGGWIEFLGCGLVHPNVLRAGGIDPARWSGFAFGMGLDRLVMLRYGIEDIRHFMSGNLRFLNQF